MGASLRIFIIEEDDTVRKISFATYFRSSIIRPLFLGYWSTPEREGGG